MLRDNSDITEDDYNATLYLVSSSADQFIQKVGESQGGLYTIDYAAGMRTLLVRVLKSMIQSKYETPNESEEKRDLPTFIFSLLLKKGLVEEEKVECLFLWITVTLMTLIFSLPLFSSTQMMRYDMNFIDFEVMVL